MTSTCRLLLASGSPRRRDLLARLGVPFEVLEPNAVDESAVRGSVEDRCRELAVQKARWGLENWSGERSGLRVIGSDTLVALGDGAGERKLGKPRDREDARRMLAELSGRTHRVVTGVAMAGAEPASGVEVSEVRFRDLTPEEIDAYVDSGDADGKAGAYGIQSLGRRLVAEFRGCYYNIVGLPLALLAAMLRPEWDVRWTCDCDRHPLQEGGRVCGAGFSRR